MSTVSEATGKEHIREEALKRRDAIPEEVRAIKSLEIKERLLSLEQYRQSTSILLFCSFRTEVDTIPIIKAALKDEKRVVLPRVNRGLLSLELYQINSLDDLTAGYMEILEPVPDKCSQVIPDEMEFVVLPGVAFDLSGGRIGYGGGCYDKLLGSLHNRPLLTAIAFEEQIMKQVPVEVHDVRVDMIITDRRIIEVAQNEP